MKSRLLHARIFMCISLLYMIADFHNDFLTEGKGSLSDIACEAKYMVCALYRGARSDGQVEKLLRRFCTEHANNQFLGLEDAGYIVRIGAETVARYSPVYASLTWNFENELAGGCLEDTGLKRAGAEAVRRLTSLGIAVDCAHLGKRAFAKVMDMTDMVVVSHACSAALYPHPRNLEDRQAQEIVSRGGMIGITFVGSFLSKRPSAEDVFAHADHFVQKFGPEYFCFGTDFYGSDDLPDGLKCFADADRLRTYFMRAGYEKSVIDGLFVINLRNYLLRNRH